MFDIGWSELLIIGALLLVVVGPKELPTVMRSVGKYAGMLRRQATEFRGYVEDALREVELEDIKKDMTGLRDEVADTVRQATQDLESEFDDARRELDATAKSAGDIDVDAHNAKVLEKEARASEAATTDAEPEDAASGERSVPEPDSAASTNRGEA